jgi:hypothetical protein
MASNEAVTEHMNDALVARAVTHVPARDAGVVGAGQRQPPVSGEDAAQPE